MLVTESECPKCHAKQGERHKATKKRPSMATLEQYVFDGVARATDGCRVEPDGHCEHGHASWLMVLGYV
jgi:hypothetical protein